jgi:hypothetical protein
MELDYIALGHIHKAQFNLAGGKAFYPGSAIALGYGEPGEHGVILGELSKYGIKYEFVKLISEGVQMKKLILAEKPSVARNIAEALDCKIRNNGFIEGSEYIITWAFGHLLTLYDCKDYDDKLALWDFNNFPYIPEELNIK